MCRNHLRVLVAMSAFYLAPTMAWGDASEPESPGMTLFDQQVKPVLVASCYECHSQQSGEIEAGLELDSPTGMLRGGDSGPILVSHDTDSSLLLRMLRHDEDVSAMPPGEKLDDEVIVAFEEWIRLGAPDSRKESGPTAREVRLDAAQKHWSFQRPVFVPPPQVKGVDWPRSPVDNFVLAAIEAEGLTQVADANRKTLVRRIYFDLIGLPPTPLEVEQFVANDSPDAVAELVDSLLDSPRFGERWGRHWLDVVRYAESSGMEFNFSYPHAWPYRDYVIDALNQDKPYDVFLREQIAGDLIPVQEDETDEAIEARRIATSILAFGPKRHNSSGSEFQMDVVDDQIDTVFRSTLAMTVACARCHDHKFDAIPTKDYYALAGIFLSTEPLFGSIKQKYSNNPTDLLPIGPAGEAKHAAAMNHEEQIALAEKQLADKRKEHTEATETTKLATETQSAAEELVNSQIAALQDGATAQPEATKALDDANSDLQAVVEQVAALDDEITALDAELAELQKNRPSRPPYAMSARDRATPADTKVAIRGDFRERGDVVPRGFLSAVKTVKPVNIDATSSGRLELAAWITSPDNPLTARVMVNRVWHHLFGRGLVTSVDNFGIIGQQPTHPELLDTLAIAFMEDGWSVKRLIRMIMLSRTYQLSSSVDPANAKIDPDNRLFWRASPRRLEAEAIRDAILAVSGQLVLDRPNGSTVTALGDQLVRGIPVDKIQPPSNHRSIFLPIVRDYVPELFDLFDFPSPSLVSGSRSVTNVPAQALYLRNSIFVTEQAAHASRRLLASTQTVDDRARADLALRWALSRAITDVEREGAMQLVNQVREAAPDDGSPEVDAWAAWFHTLFTTAEFRYLVDTP
jgi:cytochrome c553